MKTKTCGECKYFVRSEYLDVCTVFCEDYKSECLCCDYFNPRTNGDKIRQMSDEELAKKFGYPCPPLYKKHCRGDNPEECAECWLNWLKQEAKDE